MGYTTNFVGQFDLDKQLTLDDFNLLNAIANHENNWQDKEDTPGAYCKWVPTTDGRGIQWNELEKFNCYVEWLQWIIDQILIPRGYTLTGSVAYQGEDVGDSGMLVIEKGKVIQQKYDPRNVGVNELVEKGLQDHKDKGYWYLEQIAEKLDIKKES